MSAQSTPSLARRVRRPGWRDPRLGLGVLLVAASVAVGTWAVSGSRSGTPVYVAAQTLTPGQPVGAELLQVVRARIPTGAGVYLRADEPLPDGAVVTRLVGEGELVPVAAIGHADEVDVRAVSITVGGALSGRVVPGALVDLWVRPAGRVLGDETSPDAVLVAAGLRVADVAREDGLLAGAAASTVEVLVPDDRLAEVLTALAADAEPVLVPLPGGS